MLYPLIAFYMYWSEFNGTYTDMDLLWGGIVAVALGVAIFLYEPLAKRIEHFSPAWFLLFLVFIGIFGFGWVLSTTHFPLPYTAWGSYALWFAILMPVIHQLFHNVDKRQKGSFYKRIRFTPDEDVYT